MQKFALQFEHKQDRTRIRNLIRSLGVKVLHDSGGRVMVIETDRDPDEVRQRLPEDVRITPADKIKAKDREQLDVHDDLFVRALKLRSSKKYRKLKADQVPGETPEEQLLVSAGCEVED